MRRSLNTPNRQPHISFMFNTRPAKVQKRNSLTLPNIKCELWLINKVAKQNNLTLSSCLIQPRECIGHNYASFSNYPKQTFSHFVHVYTAAKVQKQNSLTLPSGWIKLQKCFPMTQSRRTWRASSDMSSCTTRFRGIIISKYLLFYLKSIRLT